MFPLRVQPSPRTTWLLGGGQLGESQLRADARDELGDLLDEAGAMVAVELGPGREGARVGANDEQLAVEVIDLVLVGAGLEAMDDLVDRSAVAVPRADVEVHRALDHA